MTVDSRQAPSQNRKLYRDDQRYLRGLRPAAQGKYAQTVLRPIARDYATSVAGVRTAVEFVDAVNQIAMAVGESAKKLLLSAKNPLLTPVLVGNLCRLSREQAANGLHPLARPVPAGTATEFVVWDYDLHRLRCAARYLGEKEPDQPARSPVEKTAVHRHAIATRVAAAAISMALERFVPPGSPDTANISMMAQGMVLSKCAMKARKLVEAVAHDLPLALSQRLPSPRALEELLSATHDVHALASRLADLTRPGTTGQPNRALLVSDRPEGPDSRPGTYIMIMLSERPSVLRAGRLETFWLPAGFLIYVGSACGGGGIKKRTDRHRIPDAPRMWNLDHHKAIASPKEVWWTEHVETVECRWAMALAGLPGYRCPAPRFGGNDCKSLPSPSLPHVRAAVL